jgi:hypothetical protein
LPKIKWFEILATIACSFALPSQSMIHKQFLSRDGNATILPPLHYHRQKILPVYPRSLTLIKPWFCEAWKVEMFSWRSHPRLTRAYWLTCTSIFRTLSRQSPRDAGGSGGTRRTSKRL